MLGSAKASGGSHGLAASGGHGSPLDGDEAGEGPGNRWMILRVLSRAWASDPPRVCWVFRT